MPCQTRSCLQTDEPTAGHGDSAEQRCCSACRFEQITQLGTAVPRSVVQASIAQGRLSHRLMQLDAHWRTQRWRECSAGSCMRHGRVTFVSLQCQRPGKNCCKAHRADGSALPGWGSKRADEEVSRGHWHHLGADTQCCHCLHLHGSALHRARVLPHGRRNACSVSGDRPAPCKTMHVAAPNKNVYRCRKSPWCQNKSWRQTGTKHSCPTGYSQQLPPALATKLNPPERNRTCVAKRP